jgi:RES domain-containing protein
VTAQTLDRVLTAYRIGDLSRAYRIFDATGSKLYMVRWNTAASRMVYASRHGSTAMLEKLAHGSGRLSGNLILVMAFAHTSARLGRPGLHRCQSLRRSPAGGKAIPAAHRAERGGAHGTQRPAQPGASGVHASDAPAAPASLVGPATVPASHVVNRFRGQSGPVP